MFNQQKQQIDFNDINELYYILPIDNLESVLKNGILSHKRVEKMEKKASSLSSLSSSSSASSSSSNSSHSLHVDISNQGVQERREDKLIMRADESKVKILTLHQHVNFYIQPHNAMMFNRRTDRNNLCILRIRKELFARGDAILSNRNASTSSASFFKIDEWRLSPRSTETIKAMNLKGVMPPRYIDDSDFEERKKIRQAEALFPYEVRPEFINGIFVYNANSLGKVKNILSIVGRDDINVSIHESFFMPGNKYQNYTYILDPFNIPQHQPLNLNLSLPESSSSETEEDSTDFENSSYEMEEDTADSKSEQSNPTCG